MFRQVALDAEEPFEQELVGDVGEDAADVDAGEPGLDVGDRRSRTRPAARTGSRGSCGRCTRWPTPLRAAVPGGRCHRDSAWRRLRGSCRRRTSRCHRAWRSARRPLRAPSSSAPSSPERTITPGAGAMGRLARSTSSSQRVASHPSRMAWASISPNRPAQSLRTAAMRVVSASASARICSVVPIAVEVAGGDHRRRDSGRWSWASALVVTAAVVDAGVAVDSMEGFSC